MEELAYDAWVNNERYPVKPLDRIIALIDVPIFQGVFLIYEMPRKDRPSLFPICYMIGDDERFPDSQQPTNPRFFDYAYDGETAIASLLAALHPWLHMAEIVINAEWARTEYDA